MANMLVGGKTPMFSSAELEEMGYKIMVSPVSSLTSTGYVLRKLTRTLLEEGSVLSMKSEMLEFGELKSFLGVDQ